MAQKRKLTAAENKAVDEVIKGYFEGLTAGADKPDPRLVDLIENWKG
jgi:hypothetical protein